MQPVHDPLRWHSYGTHKESDLLFYQQVDILRELALVVVVVRLPSVSANLHDEEIYAERSIRVDELRLELSDLFVVKA